MDTVSLTSLAEEHLAAAREAASGRSATTLYGGRGHRLRQTIIAMRAGVELAEHSNPGEATLQVLSGRIVMLAGDARWDLAAGDHVAIPDARHSVDAIDDSVFLLTVAK